MDIKRLFELANPLLSVKYDTGEVGLIRRCDIVKPSAPVALHVNQTTLSEGQTYQASEQEPWVAPTILMLTGVDTELAVLFEVDRTISRIPRNDMIPFPPAPIHLYDQFQARLKGKLSTAIMAPRESEGQ